jgi:hypothetical protein
MLTFLILLIFVGGPLALFAFIVFAVIHRAKQRKLVAAAATKYLNS